MCKGKRFVGEDFNKTDVQLKDEFIEQNMEKWKKKQKIKAEAKKKIMFIRSILRISKICNGEKSI